MAHQSGTFPELAAIVLTGGYTPPEPVTRLLDGLPQELPIIITDLGTFETATVLAGVRGQLMATTGVKIETALRIFADSVDGDAVLAAIDVGGGDTMTPLMFQFQLIDRARSDRRHVVLPEGEDERVLRATASLLRLGVAELTLLGDENEMRSNASALGLDITGANLLSPRNPELIERFAAEYTRLRAAKGMTVELARVIVTDVSFSTCVSV